MPTDNQTDTTIGSDVVEVEFTRFIEGMDLDVDPAGLDDEDKKSLEEAMRRVKRAMATGRLLINEKCEPVFSPLNGKAITFAEPKGSTFMAADQKKKGHDGAKAVATLAEMTGENPGRFSSMPGRDLKVCLALLGLFMAG
jgi:DNA-binding protein YbaB